MSKKLTIEYIREQFLKEGYSLVSKQYINNLQKLECVCPKGHTHIITFEREDYVLVSDKYTNSRNKLNYNCPLGHTHSMSWGHWSSGERCSSCWNIDRFGAGNPSWKGGVSFE